MVETGCRVVRCSDVTIQISVFIITVIDIYTIAFGSHIILTMYSIHLDQDCYYQISSICLQHSRFGASKVALAIRARSGAYE